MLVLNTPLFYLATAIRADPAVALGYISLGSAALLFAWYIIAYMISPLRRYPGPRLAAWTNWWRFRLAYSGNYRVVLKELHDKHGPIVRIGPNLLSLNYPELIRQIYSTDQKFPKTSFYNGMSVAFRGTIVANILTSQDPAEHSRLRRPMVKSFSMNSVLAMEAIVDDVASDLAGHMDKATSQDHFDLGEMLASYTWDVISETTFGQRFDYMRKGYDFNGLMKASQDIADYFGIIGQIPLLHTLFGRILKPTGLINAGVFCEQSITKRRTERSNPEKYTRRNDFLDSFLDAQAANSAATSDAAVFSVTLTNFLGGADTTLSAMQCAMHLLLTHPHALQSLRAALDDAGLSEPLCKPTLTAADVPFYARLRAVPYLDAVFRESLRLRPSIGMTLERRVPADGLVLPTGEHVRGGTLVGMNGYVTGQNTAVYGTDAHEFRPERWLPQTGETSEQHMQRTRKMSAAEFFFGGGARMCIGRNLAIVEIFKVLALLVARYDLQLRDQKEFRSYAGWLVRQKGLVVSVKRREGVAG